MKHREEKFEGEVGKVFTLCSEGLKLVSEEKKVRCLCSDM